MKHIHEVNHAGGTPIDRCSRVQLYLPDDLYEALKEHELPASRLPRDAARQELSRARPAEPGGTVLTGNLEDLRGLAQHAEDVRVHPA